VEEDRAKYDKWMESLLVDRWLVNGGVIGCMGGIIDSYLSGRVESLIVI
jgi:hypothetical protein